MSRKRQRSDSAQDADDLLRPVFCVAQDLRSSQRHRSPILSEAAVVSTEAPMGQNDWDEQDAPGGNSNALSTLATTCSSSVTSRSLTEVSDAEIQAKVASLGVADEVQDQQQVAGKHVTGRSPLTRRALVWFRRDLRLHDNLALNAAIRAQQQMQRTGQGEMALLPVYILHRPVRQRCGPLRFQFLLEAVQDLAGSMADLQGQLLVLRGEAEEVLRAVLPAWGITDIFFEAGVMPYAVARDERVRVLAASLNVHVTSFRGVTLYDPHEVIRLNGGQAPTDYERLLEITNNMPQPAQPIPAPVQLSNAARFTPKHLFALLKNYCRHSPRVANTIAGIDASAKKSPVELFVVPPLTALGLTPQEPHAFLYGGETEAMRLLDTFSRDEQRVGLFEKPRTSPVAVDAPSTTSMSPYLVFGCLSAREFFYRIMFIQLQWPLRPGPAQVTLEGQLMWREFFYCYACGTPNFDSQELNPSCKQIKWRLRAENRSPRPEDDRKTNTGAQDADEKLAMHQLQCWKDGRTGFPWIDAVMRQINQEGWTHHAGRHAVACFLTRGVLYISWLRGAEYFREKLLDLDWPVNIGNWLWVSASCFFSDYRRVASPSTFPQRWDAQGQFIRKFIPALRNMPDKFVFEPWKAPLKVQRDAGCLMGKDYPFPIVDAKHAMERCMVGMSHAYSDAETESTTSSATSSRATADESVSGGSSPWSADDMCYSYRGADSKKT